MVISYDVAGHGPDVLLLHSGVCDRRMWDPQWPALSERFRVVRPDLRGFGETPLTPGRFSHADDVVALLDHLDVEGAVELNIRTWLGPDATAEVADHVRLMQRHAFDVQLAAEDNAVAPGPVPVSWRLACARHRRARSSRRS